MYAKSLLFCIHSLITISLATQALPSSPLLTTTGFSNPTTYSSAGNHALCVSGHISVPVTGNTTQIKYHGPHDNQDLTALITDFFRRNSTLFSRIIGGQKEVSATYNIYSTLCIPNPNNTHNIHDATGKKIKSVQFLSHGGTLDRTYWDWERGYSYVDAAAKKGYPTFAFDRLGNGKSDHPDPVQIVQLPFQVEVAHVLVQRLRSGGIGGLKFDTVIGVGHSIGGALTHGHTSKYPDDFDGIILTGHSAYRGGSGIGFAGAAFQIARTIEGREDFKGLANGYFTLGPVEQALQLGFYYYPHYDRDIFKRQFATRGTSALGETLTGELMYTSVPHYTRPVLVLNGQQDFFYCQGDCLEPTDLTAESLSTYFPNADKVRSGAVTVQNVGHNLNMHLGRIEVFEKMLHFVEDVEALGLS